MVASLLSRDACLEVVGIARDGTHALKLVEDLSPDVVVTDLEMPGMHGADFVTHQMSRGALPIVLFTALEMTDPLAQLAMSAGAVDFLRKPSGFEEVCERQQLLQIKIAQAKCRLVARMSN